MGISEKLKYLLGCGLLYFILIKFIDFLVSKFKRLLLLVLLCNNSQTLQLGSGLGFPVMHRK